MHGHEGAVERDEAPAEELDRLRRRDRWLTEQVQRNGPLALDLMVARSVLARWFDKFNLARRWPCLECGRSGPDADLATYEVTLSTGARQIVGCTRCNADTLLAETARALWSAPADQPPAQVHYVLLAKAASFLRIVELQLDTASEAAALRAEIERALAEPAVAP